MKHDDLFHEALVASLLALPQVQEYKQAVVVQQDESMEVMCEK
jgi:hypothetical protein